MFGKKKDSKRIRGSLRGRIIKSMMLLTLVTILLLSTMLLGLVLTGVRGMGTMLAHMSGMEIEKYITSPVANRKAGIGDMSELSKNPAAVQLLIQDIEKHNTIDLAMLLDQKKMVEKTRFDLVDNTSQSGDISHQDLPEPFQMLGLKLFIGDELIYENDGNMSESDGLIRKFMNTKTSVDVISPTTDTTIGSLEVQIHKRVLMAVIWILFIAFDVICLLALVVAKLISYLIVIPTIKPLNRLSEKLAQVASEDIEWAVHKQVVFDKPLKEIALLTDSTNRILEKMKDYSETLEVQKDELEAQNEELEAMSSELKTVNHGLNHRNQQMSHILGNVKQGFLMVGQDLLIDNEYSAECEHIFERLIGGERLSYLMYRMNPEEASFMDQVFKKILSGEDPDLYLPLLPTEIKVNRKHLEVVYSVVEDHVNGGLNMMVVISDRTSQKDLQRQMDYEKVKLQMVVKIVSNRDAFVDLLKEYMTFAEQGINDLGEAAISCDHKCREMFRIIHNFKGNFSQYDLALTVEKLHLFEDYLSEFQNQEAESMCVAFENLDMVEWIQEDLDVITSYLGEDFLEDQSIYRVTPEQIAYIDEKMQDLLSAQDYFSLAPLIKDLKCKNIKTLLAGYPDYVNKLAERMEKEIFDLTIEGDDIRVDLDDYRDLAKSLVHVFRNAVDHGIESVEERVEAGKQDAGSITCEVIDRKSNMIIEIGDDGRGIDVDLIRERLMQSGMASESVEAMSQHELYNQMFKDGFSTRSTVSPVSGRGVGMASVLEAVERIEGRIEVDSNRGEGTVFRLTLPKFQQETVELIPPETMFEIITAKTQYHFKKMTGLELALESDINRASKIKLNTYTALVNYHGLRNGLVLLSLNEHLAKELVDGFVMGAYEDHEYMDLLEDSIAEIANIIIGNSFEDLGHLGERITIGTPTMLCYQGASVKYCGADILTSRVLSQNYGMVLSLVNLDKDIKEEVEWHAY